eukprot:508124-Hanusia_phi.AAC.2
MSSCLVEEDDVLCDDWNLALLECIQQCPFVEELEDTKTGPSGAVYDFQEPAREGSGECSFDINEVFQDFSSQEDNQREQDRASLGGKISPSQFIRPVGNEKTVYVRGRKEGSDGKVVEITREVLQEFFGQKIESVAAHLVRPDDSPLLPFISFPHLTSPHVHLPAPPLPSLSRVLTHAQGVGKSTMKLACRRLGIHKWPYTNKGVRRSGDCAYGAWGLKNAC